jgi:hypothetical protein
MSPVYTYIDQILSDSRMEEGIHVRFFHRLLTRSRKEIHVLDYDISDYRSLKKRISSIRDAERDPESSVHEMPPSGSPIDKDAASSSSPNGNTDSTSAVPVGASAQVAVASGMRPSREGQLVRTKSRTVVFKPVELKENKHPALRSFVSLRKSKNPSRQDVTLESLY